jgi:hypothetical protein
MNEPLDELFFEWLCEQVHARERDMWILEMMYLKEFTWFIPNDDNRLMEGVSQRELFLEERQLKNAWEWTQLGCSFLELMLAVARELSFLTQRELPSCFWELMRNLGLAEPTATRRDVNHAMNKVINRTYSYSGEGGLFPLEHPHEDQRKVEIWYQMQAYLIERETY